VLLVLIGENGIRLPVMYMPIQSQDGATKQDCELNATKRLLANLFKEFPRTKFAFLMDALYPCEPIMSYLKEKQQLFVIGFKEGCIPTLWDEVKEQLAVFPNSEIVEDNYEVPPGRILEGTNLYRRLKYITDLQYAGMRLSCIKSEHSNMPFDTPSDTPELDQCTFCYLTNAKVNAKTVIEVEQAGRSRWSIEDGFNHSKNRGSKTKHKYARKSDIASQLYLQIIYIAEFFDNLITHCSWFFRHFSCKWDIGFVFTQLLSSLAYKALPINFEKQTFPKQLEFAT
jgi:hypothetical protein